MSNITRIKNNQVTDNTIEYQKLKDGTLVGSKFNANLTLNSNVTILGNLTVANSFAQLNSINTYINDPVVVFNNNYTGSPTYDIGMLINRNLDNLAPYGAVNAAFVWKEADASFEALMTTETGTTAGAINNSGWANLRVGNLTAFSTTSGLMSAAAINNTPIGNSAPAIGSFTYLTAVDGFQTANAVINGGYISTLTNATITTATLTNTTAVNFYSGNIFVDGGYMDHLANIAADTAYLTNLNSTNGNVTTLQVNNFNSGNAAITGGQTYIGTGGQLIANTYVGMGYFTNLSASNVNITTENVTTLYAENLSSSNLLVNGDTVINGNLSVTGALVYLDTQIEIITGIEVVAGNLVANSGTETTSVSTGAVVVEGGMGISGKIITGGNIVAGSGTTSVDKTTGAVVITGNGGLAVGGNIHAGTYNTSLHNIRGNLLLGLGEDIASDSALTINLNNEAPISSFGVVHLSASPGKDSFYIADSFGSVISSGFGARHARGTPASPTAVQAGDLLGAFTARGYGATGYDAGYGSGIKIYANENFTDSARGTYTTIGAVNDGTTENIFNLVISGNGETYVSRDNVSTSPYNGALIVQGGTGVQGNLNVGTELKVTGLAYLNDITRVAGNLVANSQTESTSISTGALVVVGGAGIASNLSVGKSATFNANMIAGGDTYIRGINDETLLWAHPNSTYDQVVIGNSATNGDLVVGAKLTINSTDSMIIPVGTNAQRPGNAGGTDTIGMFRYNSTVSALEIYDGTEWDQITTQFTVIVDEQFNGDDTTVEFTMSGSSTTAATIISINGVIQVPTLAYSVGGVGSNVITFTEAPAAGDLIDVRRLATTAIVSGIASTNGYMQVLCDNNGAYIYTGVSGTQATTYWEPTGAKVNSSSNISVPSANTVTTLDSFSATTYRSARYVVQVTRGADYQVSEVLMLHNGTTATAVEYGTIQTNGNLGVVTADISSGSARLRFVASGTTNNVRITKDYNLI